MKLSYFSMSNEDQLKQLLCYLYFEPDFDYVKRILNESEDKESLLILLWNSIVSYPYNINIWNLLSEFTIQDKQAI